jgi:hypothetical protein
MQSDDFVYFSVYALFMLVLPFSSFFFTLLECYGLHRQHLSPHFITLVAIFIHLYEMYVCVRPSVRLFHRFHVLCASRRSPTPIAATTSSTDPWVHRSTSLHLASTSGTIGGRTG